MTASIFRRQQIRDLVQLGLVSSRALLNAVAAQTVVVIPDEVTDGLARPLTPAGVRAALEALSGDRDQQGAW